MKYLIFIAYKGERLPECPKSGWRNPPLPIAIGTLPGGDLTN